MTKRKNVNNCCAFERLNHLQSCIKLHYIAGQGCTTGVLKRLEDDTCAGQAELERQSEASMSRFSLFMWCGWTVVLILWLSPVTHCSFGRKLSQNLHCWALSIRSVCDRPVLSVTYCWCSSVNSGQSAPSTLGSLKHQVRKSTKRSVYVWRQVTSIHFCPKTTQAK